MKHQVLFATMMSSFRTTGKMPCGDKLCECSEGLINMLSSIDQQMNASDVFERMKLLRCNKVVEINIVRTNNKVEIIRRVNFS